MPKTYKTWEAIKMLTENPKLIFTQAYVCKNIKFLTSNEQLLIECESKHIAYNNLLYADAEWELVQEPVNFMTAVEAFDRGKNIYCELPNGTKTKYQFKEYMGLMDGYRNPIGSYEILKGKWYIEG